MLLGNNSRIKVPDDLAGSFLNDDNGGNASQRGKDITVLQGAIYLSVFKF